MTGQYIILDELDEPIFSEHTQTIFHNSIGDCLDSLQDYLGDAVAEDLDTGEITTAGEEVGQGFRIFQEIES